MCFTDGLTMGPEVRLDHVKDSLREDLVSQEQLKLLVTI